MHFSQYSHAFPPYDKKKCANLVWSTSNLWPLNTEHTTINWYMPIEKPILGSIQFIPDSIRAYVPDTYGIADDATLYYSRDHYEYWIRYGISKSDLAVYTFPNMTSNTAPAPYVITTSKGSNPGCAFDSNETGTYWDSGGVTPSNTGVSISGNKDEYYLCKYIVMRNNITLLQGQFQGCKTVAGNIGETLLSHTINGTSGSGAHKTYYVDNGTNKNRYAKFRLNVVETTATFDQLIHLCSLRIGFNVLEDSDNYEFRCPDLQSLAPAGFKTYIYIGS